MYKELIELPKEYLICIMCDTTDEYSKELYEETKNRLRQILDRWGEFLEFGIAVKDTVYPNGISVIYISVDKDISLLAKLAMTLI